MQGRDTQEGNAAQPPSSSQTEWTPNNMRFVQIPNVNESRDVTDELSFVLRASPIAGVGVYITHRVLKGTYLALFWDETVRRIPYAEFENNPLLKGFALVYGVERKDYVCVPHNFSHMEIGWYLNHSDTPNAIHDKRWIAARDIDAGEEITIDYGYNY